MKGKLLTCITAALVAMFLVPQLTQKPDTDNPWAERLTRALAAVEQQADVTNLTAALDAAYRADDWRAGVKIADLAHEKDLGEALLGMRLRAYWRAGRIADVLAILPRINLKTADRETLVAAIPALLATGRLEEAIAAADRLDGLKSKLTAADLATLIGVRLEQKQYGAIAPLVRMASKRLNPENGYPESLLEENFSGLAEFFKAAGSRPLNEVTKFGAAEMAPIAVINLPAVNVFINGRGPYRMLLDTGGSIVLSLDDQVAKELGIKSVGEAAIRGVGGKESSGQAIIDNVRIGGIELSRVMARTFPVADRVMNLADGIVGTGVFADARMTMDFANGQLIVEPSSQRVRAGVEQDVLVVSDAKLIARTEINDLHSVLSLLDSGADVVAISDSLFRTLFPDTPPVHVDMPAMGVGQGAAPGLALTNGATIRVLGKDFANSGGVSLDLLDKLLSPYMGLEVDVLVGMPVFREMRSVTVDFPRRKLWVEWLLAE